MAAKNNAPVVPTVSRGPDMGNVPLQDSYLRTKQNFDAIYDSLNNVVKMLVPTSVSQQQLDVIQKSLQAQGTNPLNLTGLIPLNNLTAIQLTGTHNKRKGVQPSGFPIGTLWFETDRTVLYTVLQLGGGFRWVYETGIYSAAIVNRPTDLGPFDAGFLFYATDQAISYKWSGTTWVAKGELGVMLSDTHASRLANYAANGYPAGATFFESDRTVVYRDDGNNWDYITGIMRSNNANIPVGLGANDAGFWFYGNDTKVEQYWNGNNWVVWPRVISLNTLGGNVTLVAGNNMAITPDANNGTLTFDANAAGGGGVTSLNLLVGNVTLVPGTNVTLGVGNNNIVINAAGGGNNAGVTSINTLAGVVGVITGNAAELQISTGNNNITIGAADTWNNTTVALAASNDASPSPSTAACRWVRRGKTIHLQIYWTGTIASNSQEFKFAVPANFNTTLTYQTVAVWVTGFANNSAVLPSSCALVPGSPNLIFIRGTTNYLASNNAYTIIIGGSYESA